MVEMVQFKRRDIMALLQVNFMSKSLMRKVPIMVVLPVDKLNFSITSEIAERDNNPFKTLYLLHGGFGNYTSWVSETRIQRLAEGKNLAVVMPSGDNSFYLNQPESGNFYEEFIGKELVDITRKMFPLSKEREDTFIAKPVKFLFRFVHTIVYPANVLRYTLHKFGEA
ncbi:MAG: Putative esterase, partial [Petrotoga mobilis]